MGQRVVLFGGRVIVLDGLCKLLEADPRVDVAGRASTVTALVELCGRHVPDAVLVSVDRHGQAVEGIAAARRGLPVSRIVALYTVAPMMQPGRLVAAGATRVVSMDSPLGELVDALVTDDALGDVASISRQDASTTLTPRELEVVRLIGGGLTSTEIAFRLGISPKTVENHKQRLFVKLGVSNQAHAVSVAIRQRLLGRRPA